MLFCCPFQLNFEQLTTSNKCLAFLGFNYILKFFLLSYICKLLSCRSNGTILDFNFCMVLYKGDNICDIVLKVCRINPKVLNNTNCYFLFLRPLVCRYSVLFQPDIPIIAANLEALSRCWLPNFQVVRLGY